MKKVALLIFALGFTASTLFAQQHNERKNYRGGKYSSEMRSQGKPEDIAARKLEGLTKRLNLSQEQQQVAYDIELNTMKMIWEIKSAKGDRDKKIKLRKKINQERTRYDELLNDDQKKKFNTERYKRRAENWG